MDFRWTLLSGALLCLLSVLSMVGADGKLKNYVVKEGDLICFRLQTQQMVVAVDLGQSYNESRIATVPQLNATGHCGESVVSMVLEWTDRNDSYSLTIKSVKNSTAAVFYLSDITLDYELDVPGAVNNTVKGTGYNGTESFKTKLDQHYACENGFVFTLSQQANITTNITITNLKFQAFSNSTSSRFTGVENNCKSTNPPGKTSAIVPIIVGAALGGMILLVLVGYCIGRRRNRSGYSEIEA